MGQCVDVNSARQAESLVPGAHLKFLGKVRGRGRQRWACERSPPSCSGLPSWVLAPECRVSAEKKRASPAVRQEKGSSLEGKERVIALKKNQHPPFL